MCVLCFPKALAHVFKIYFKASYNFESRTWPIEFQWDEPYNGGNARGCIRGRGRQILVKAASQLFPPVSAFVGPGGDRVTGWRFLSGAKQLPGQLASYVMAHSLGRWLLYPGSMFLLNQALLPILAKGQARLQEEYHGKRAKLMARDGNKIDTMFVDRRAAADAAEHRGKQLVVCCEGNVSFYEWGCLSTPLQTGYSVLGWNHPGFGGSTGQPYPQNDANAVDVVIQYATRCLGFKLQDIIVYGWSLGGYSATWAAMTYPSLGSLVLDATFDDLLPLALNVMPKSWKKLVVRTVKDHFNLNVGEQLCKYSGPVLLIRRTKDEVITTCPDLEDQVTNVRYNRANELLLQLLEHRYPDVMTHEGRAAVHDWLRAANPSQEAAICRRYKVDEEWCLGELQSYKSGQGLEIRFPWRVGKFMASRDKQQIALFLAQKHMKNIEASHWSLLKPNDFQMPWKL
ncbi:PREDICTED: abhydrolase domain-containing protein 16B [Gekko japonicus]|uniref:Abhydrolase domain-containing protein 16B n=1 Tax=Gekko japonicus TaxID=146911 RepID=A0ABM1JPR4_GEKJA|nr:PREDICTED: abhydrolase domain-containing protein 16B [Gekko japonicus]